MPRAFDDPREEMDYLKQVKEELDAATSKDEIVDIWKLHYLKVGHRKLGRLLIGRDLEAVVAGSARSRRRTGGAGGAPTGSEPM